MALLSVNDARVSFGPEDILLGVTGEINAGDRIGLVGRNGAGKTTLLHVLTGELKPNFGARHLARGTSIALVEQVQTADDVTTSVYQEALSAVGELIALEEALERASEDFSAGKPGAAETYAKLQDDFEARGGYHYTTRVSNVLTGLGFKATEWDEPVRQLSGGQRTRLALARALLSQPDLLLLDEPTNHIDLDAMTWLDGFLSRWPGTLVVASHDRYFLDRVANRVWLLNDGVVRAYRGNYSAFEEQRSSELALLQKQAEAQAEYIAKEESFIQRYRAGQRAREARGRQKRLDRIQRIEGPRSQRSTSFKLAAERSGDIVLTTESLLVGYGDEALLRVPDVTVERGDRVALIGPNGTGKTTLLKTIAGQLPAVRGGLRLGARVKAGHYWQEAENLDSRGMVLEEIGREKALEPQEARDILGRFLFSGEDVFKPVAGLSGGERSRLALAKLMIEQANLLLLDEPTNHLDIPSRESLEAALDAYPGTIILVSHDRRLIARLATRIWSVEEGAIVDFEGDYEEYLERREAVEAEEQRTKTKVEAAAKPRPQESNNALQKRLKTINDIERQVDEHEREIAAVSQQINEASENGQPERIEELGKRFVELQAELDGLIERWSASHV